MTVDVAAKPEPLPARAAKKLVRLFKLHVTRDPFTVAYRDWVVGNNETRRLDYPLDTASTVFDVGGYLGDFAARIHERYGCRVFVFEPVEEFCRRCEERFGENERIRCFRFGLSVSSGKAAITTSGDATSLFRPGLSRQAETISLKSFSAVLEECCIDEVDLMKVNIEGAEYDLLDQMLGSGAMRAVKFLQVQFHDFVPDAVRRRDAIREKLRETHDEMWAYPFVWESWMRRSSEGS